jgi:hypothetical protein
LKDGQAVETSAESAAVAATPTQNKSE